MIPGLALPASTLATNWLGAMPPPQQVTPLLWLVLWALSWSWILLIFPILHLLLTFPDGRLLSPRWRLAVAFEVAMVAIFLGFTAFAQDLGVLVDDEKVWTVANPIGFLPNDLFDAVAGPRLGGRAGGDHDRERGRRRAPFPPGIDHRAPAAEVAAAGGRPVRRRLRGRVARPRPGRRRVGPVRALAGRDPDLGGDRRAPLPAVRDRPHHQPDGLVGGDHGRPGRRVRRWRARAPGRAGGRHAGADARRRRIDAGRVRAVPAAPPSRPAGRGPAVRSGPRRRRPRGFRASRTASAASWRSRPSRTTCSTTIDGSLRPSTQGLWLRVARDRQASGS